MNNLGNEKTKYNNCLLSEGGVVFSLGAVISLAVSLIFSLLLATISLSSNVDINTLINSDSVILLSFAISSLGVVLTILIASKKYYLKPLKLLSFKVKKESAVIIWVATLLITFGVMFALSEVNNYLVEFFKSIGITIPEISVPTKTPLNVTLTIIFVCLLPAVVEETLFRGILTFSLSSRGEVFAIIFSGLTFSLFHMQPAQTIYQFIFGALFALIALRSDSILPVVVSHFINNLFIILNYYFFNIVLEGTLKTILIIIGFVSLFLGIFIILRFTKPNKNHIKDNKSPKSFITFAVGFVVCIAMWFANLI